jgi:hypothetical protein
MPMGHEARRRASDRRLRDRRRRDVPVAENRRWLPERRREPRRDGLVARLHAYAN